MTYPPDFEQFWHCYPNKASKRDALKAWEQTAEDRPDMDALLDALEVMCWSDKWRKNDGEFIPYPATWLRADGWEDRPVKVIPMLSKEDQNMSMGVVDLGREAQIREQRQVFDNAREAIHPKTLKLLDRIGKP